MVQRYSLQVREARQPDARVRNFAGPDAFGAQAGNALSRGVGDVFNVALQGRQRLDAARVEEANTLYAKSLMDYTTDLQVNRQGKKAFGATQDFTSFSKSEMERIAAGLDSNEQRYAFIRAAAKTAFPYHGQTNKLEQTQIHNYEFAAAKSSAETANNMVVAAPLDPEVKLRAVEMIRDSVASMADLRGWDDETTQNLMDALVSHMDAQAITTVAASDPMLANKMIEQSPYLTAADKTALTAKVKLEVERVQARGIANEAMSRFGGEYDAANGIEWIRQNVSDPDLADRAVSQYSIYMREKNMGIALEKSKLHEAQNENYNAAVLDYAQDNPWSDEEIMNSNLSDAQKATLLNKNNATSTYGQSTQKLEKTIPGWNQLSEHQQDMYYFADANTTEEVHTAAIALLNEGLGSGLTKDQVKEYVNRRIITREEGRRFNAAIDGWDKKNDAQVAGIKNVFDAAMNPSKKESPVNGMYPVSSYEIKKAELNAYIAGLSAQNDPDIVEKIGVKAQMIQNEIIQEVFSLTGKGENDTETRDIPWVPQPFGVGPKQPTAFAQGVADAKKMLQDTTASFAASTPTKVQPGPFQAMEIAVTHGTVSADVLGGDYAMTSGFDRPRDGGKRVHGGYDFAAPKGTLIKAPSVIGSGLTVSQIVSNQGSSTKGAGNRVVLTGKDEFGNTVEWQFNHMSGVNSTLKVGDIVAPGTPLGAVGNSGSVIASLGGDGSHLDLKLKVNGKNTDIAKYYASINVRRNSQSGLKKQPETPENQPAAQAAPEGPAKVQADISGMSEDEKAEYFLGGGF